jgi:hypothetical protein
MPPALEPRLPREPNEFRAPTCACSRKVFFVMLSPELRRLNALVAIHTRHGNLEQVARYRAEFWAAITERQIRKALPVLRDNDRSRLARLLVGERP